MIIAYVAFRIIYNPAVYLANTGVMCGLGAIFFAIMWAFLGSEFARYHLQQ